MQKWKEVWRNGFVPLLSTEALEAIRDALKNDDPRLTQGCTTNPPPLACVEDCPLQGACLLGYAGWQGEELETVGEVERFFGRMCNKIDDHLDEQPSMPSCGYFLEWYDETPRAEMIAALLPEVELALSQRVNVGHGETQTVQRVLIAE